MYQNAGIECLSYCKHLSEKKHIYCSKLHLNEKGSAKRSSLLLNYILKSHKWHDTRSPNKEVSSKIGEDTGESESLTPSPTIAFSSSSSVCFGEKLM